MDIIQMIKNYGVDTMLIALSTVVFTGLLKIPIKKIADKTKNSKKITRFVTFLPIFIGFGLTALNTYLFTGKVLFANEFYAQWLSSVSLSLAIYAFWEKFIPSEKKILSEEEIRANKAVLEELKRKSVEMDNNSKETGFNTTEQVEAEAFNSRKIILSNNKNCGVKTEKLESAVDKKLATNSRVCEIVGKDGCFEEEIKELRTGNETVFRRNDGTCKKIITASPTRYRDESGEYKEISSKLVDNGQAIVNEANSFKVVFDKNARSGKIFDLQREGKKLTMSAAGSGKMRGHVCSCKCELCSGTDNSVTATLDDGTEIQYLSLNDRIKENIIVKERQESYEYYFNLDIGDLIVEEGEHNDLLLKDKQTGKTEFRIPAPFMYDANKKRSDKVWYEIDVNGSNLAIKVVADAEFINADERAFPVTIDPQIVISEGIFTFSAEVLDDEDNYTTEDLIVYYEKTYIHTRSYITIDTSLIPVNEKTKKVSLQITSTPFASGKFSFDNTTFAAVSLKTYTVDITNHVKWGVDNSKNIDICLCYIDDTPTSIDFYISGERAPKIIVETTDEYEIGGESGGDDEGKNDETVNENQVHIKKFNLGNSAVGFVDSNKGVLYTSFNSLDIGDFAVPLSISHIHKVSDGNGCYGLNWSLNLDKKLKRSSADTTYETIYTYIDEWRNSYELKERYFYIENNKQKFVFKDLVAIELNGELSYNGKKIYKNQSCNGLTLIPQIDDFIDSENIEQKTEKQIQLEEYVNQLAPTLKKYVIYNTENLKASKPISKLEKGVYYDFIKEMHDTDILLTDSEVLQINSLHSSIEQLGIQRDLIDKEINNVGKNINPNELHDYGEEERLRKLYESQQANIDVQVEQTKEQIALLIAQAKANLDLIKETFIKYFSKEAELKLLKKQTPVNYLRDKDGIINGFNENGDLVLIADSYGNYVSIEYNDKDQIANIYDSNDKFMRFEYENDLLQSITDNRGRQTKYVYNGKKLFKVEFADGKSLEFEYSSGYMRNVIDERGIKTTITRDSATNRTTKITTNSTVGSKDTLSSVNISYGDNGTTLEYLDGSAERIKLDSAGRLSLSYTKDPAGVTETKEYTYEKTADNGRKVTCLERSNIGYDSVTTKEEYDVLSRLVKKEADWHELTDTMATRSTTTYEYDRNNNLVSESTLIEYRDDNRKITDYTECKNYSYNANGSVVLIESYVQGEEQTSGINYEERVYNDNGNVVKCIRWNSLDSSSKFYTESDCAENGQVTADRGETGEIAKEYEYVAGTDIINSVKMPDGSKFAYGRSPNNFEVTSITHSTEDGEANTTDIQYRNGLPVSVKSGNTEITYGYDSAGRKTEINVNGVKQYSAKYSLKTQYFTEDESSSYGYVTETYHSGNGDTTVKTEKYGSLDEDTGTYKITESTYVNKSLVRTVTRNGNQELSRVQNGNLVSLYFYDLENVLTDVKTYSNGSLTLTESFTFNGYGDVFKKTLEGAVEQTYLYVYKDNAARDLDYILFADTVVEDTTDIDVSEFAFKFKPLTDVNGRNTGKEIYSGANKVAAEYITYRKVGDHATNMPATVWFGSGKNISESIKYKYDSCGNICQITQNGHVIAKYTYDSLNRLVREDNKAIGKTVLFTYDVNGNITERCEYDYTSKSGEELSELACTHYSYDYEGDRLTSYNGESFVYDNLGIPTTYRGKPAKWQYGKLLASYNGVEFTYNGIGSRASKGGITFSYDSDGRLIKQSKGLEYILEFIYDNSGVAGVIYSKEKYLYRRDAQGNIIAILNGNGEVVVSYVYDAWGNHAVLDSEGNDLTETEGHIGNLNPFRYRGYYYDVETGLYYLQTRYYDPELGRFISQDSLEYVDTETINGLNLYAYCGNNPVMNVDPTGNSFQGFLTFIERFFTSLSTLCQYIVKNPSKFTVTWKQFHKFNPSISFRAFNRATNSDLSRTQSVGKIFGKVATAVAFIALAIDIGVSWYDNYKSGSPAWVTDSLVDTAYIGIKFGIGYGITALCSLIPLPVVGTLLGVGLSIGFNYFIDWIVGETGVLNTIKTWAYNAGQKIASSWNYFWSFSWI